MAVPLLQESGLEVRLCLHEIDRSYRDPATGPKAERHLFESKLLGAETLVPGGRRQAPAHRAHVLKRRSHVPPPPVTSERMRARAEAEIGTPLPIPKVVDAFEAWTGPVRDLVVAIPGRREELARELEHVGLTVGVRRGTRAARDLASEWRRRLDRERVRRDVFRTERDRLFEGASPRRERLPFRPVDQVHIHVPVPGPTSSRERPPHRVRRMHPLERHQNALIERLRPHRQSCEAGREQRRELRLVDRVRIRLDRDLRVVLDTKPRAEVLKGSSKLRDLERRRRPTAIEDGSEREVPPLRRNEIRLSEQRVDVRIRQVPEPRVRVEIAIPAPSKTEGNMNIEPGGVAAAGVGWGLARGGNVAGHQRRVGFHVLTPDF